VSLALDIDLGRALSVESERALRDVMTTAAEGGVNYWATAAYVTPHDALMVRYENPGGPADWRCCTAALGVRGVALGVERVLAPTFKVADDIRRAVAVLASDPENADIDADAADVIVQAALFGEVVFG
jgi:hypothetical protein